jgi:uncharacterized protein YerC
MSIATQLQYAELDELRLDPLNPRLGRNNTGRDVKQEKVLELMKDWTLDELAVSFLEGGGFWTQEALLVTEENLYGRKQLVVIEGNRRLAALIYLRDAYDGKPASPKWAEIAASAPRNPQLFQRIPYLCVDSRKDIEAFLGFRHVTGIAEWKPAEKAEFIAKMIDEGMSYTEVMRKIGSKTATVRQNYIAYRLLKQIEDSVADFPIEKTEERFSVMYLSLRTEGVQEYLGIDLQAEPKDIKKPVAPGQKKRLGHYARWIFGDKDKPPLFMDSRQVDAFGSILESPKGIDYLERTLRPNFDFALRIAGADEAEIVKLVEQAADNAELALARAHLHARSRKLQDAVERLGAHCEQLLTIFPKARENLKAQGD